ncbi:YkgJ family cysteine cluster protein [bacterium]|nr:YkgJ family cysteine cluster protein [bacterium]
MVKFYDKGLRFSCQQCGNCCSLEEGDIYISFEDVVAITEYLGITEKRFEEEYLQIRDRFYVVKQNGENGPCIFLTEDRTCSIYPVRPYQCRTFPFWKENLTSKKTWDDLKKFCSGIGIGKLFTKSEIDDKVTRDLKRFKESLQWMEK